MQNDGSGVTPVTVPKVRLVFFTCVILTANELFILAFVFLCIVLSTLLGGGMGETKYKLAGANEMQKVIQMWA